MFPDTDRFLVVTVPHLELGPSHKAAVLLEVGGTGLLCRFENIVRRLVDNLDRTVLLLLPGALRTVDMARVDLPSHPAVNHPGLSSTHTRGVLTTENASLDNVKWRFQSAAGLWVFCVNRIV